MYTTYVRVHGPVLGRRHQIHWVFTYPPLHQCCCVAKLIAAAVTKQGPEQGILHLRSPLFSPYLWNHAANRHYQWEIFRILRYGGTLDTGWYGNVPYFWPDRWWGYLKLRPIYGRYLRFRFMKWPLSLGRCKGWSRDSQGLDPGKLKHQILSSWGHLSSKSPQSSLNLDIYPTPVYTHHHLRLIKPRQDWLKLPQQWSREIQPCHPTDPLIIITIPGLVNVYITIEICTILRVKLTISMVIFHSYVFHRQPHDHKSFPEGLRLFETLGLRHSSPTPDVKFASLRIR